MNIFLSKAANLSKDQNVISCPQVLQLMCDQDTTLVLQQTTDAPDHENRETPNI